MIWSSLSSLCLSSCIYKIFKCSNFFHKSIIILYLNILMPPGLLKFIRIIECIKGSHPFMFLCSLSFHTVISKPACMGFSPKRTLLKVLVIEDSGYKF